MNILWCGKFDFRKQLGLAIRIISILNDLDILLHVAGSGDDKKYKELAHKLNVSDRIVWHGQVDHGKINTLMQESDLFLFTSIMDATSTVVMEAIQNRLPVICFDTCGFGTVVDDTIGVKITLTNPDKSVHDFAEVIKSLYYDRDRIQELSNNCHQRVKQFLWDYKAQMMVEIYNGIQ